MTFLPGYDAWKTREPDWDDDRPEPQDDPGPCRRCGGSGWIAVSTGFSGRYLGPGPVPEYARNCRDARCDGCGGSGQIYAEEEDEPELVPITCEDLDIMCGEWE